MAVDAMIHGNNQAVDLNPENMSDKMTLNNGVDLMNHELAVNGDRIKFSSIDTAILSSMAICKTKGNQD